MSQPPLSLSVSLWSFSFSSASYSFSRSACRRPVLPQPTGPPLTVHYLASQSRGGVSEWVCVRLAAPHPWPARRIQPATTQRFISASSSSPLVSESSVHRYIIVSKPLLFSCHVHLDPLELLIPLARHVTLPSRLIILFLVMVLLFPLECPFFACLSFALCVLYSCVLLQSRNLFMQAFFCPRLLFALILSRCSVFFQCSFILRIVVFTVLVRTLFTRYLYLLCWNPAQSSSWV